MRNIEERELEKMLDCLQWANLTAEQLQKAEAYILGESNVPDYQMKEYRNVSETVQADKRDLMKKELEHLLKRKKYEEFSKLFQILFQVFGVGLKEMIPVYELRNLLRRKENGEFQETEFLSYMPKAELIALFAETSGRDEYYISGLTFQIIQKIAQGDNSALERAVALSDQKISNGRLLIYTAYFMQNGKPESGSILGNISKLFGKEKQGNVSKAMFDKYVATVTENIKDLFQGNLTDSEEKQILSYMEKDIHGTATRNETISQLFDRHELSSFLLTLFVVCAAPNYRLSPKLQSFLKLCANGKHFDKVLSIMDKGWLRKQEVDRVLAWQRDLMLDKEKLIVWCGSCNYKEVLRKFAVSDSEIYIKALKQAGSNTHTVMIEVIKELPAQEYDKYYKNALFSDVEDRQNKMITNLVNQRETGGDVQLQQIAAEYLRGERGIEDLYPYQITGSSYVYYGNYGIILNNYKAVYGRDDFYKRCLGYLALRGHSYDLSNIQREDVNRFYEELCEVGLDIVHQFTTAVRLYDCEYSDTRKKELLEKYCTIFSAYCNDQEEEVLRAFRQAEAVGRYIGVRILASADTKYKEELFSYFGDGSKQVKEALADIISQHVDWIEDVALQLQSKKAAERELAVMILDRMPGEQTEILQKALETEKSKKIADMIRKALGTSEGEEAKSTLTVDALVKEYHKGGRKKTLAWAYETPFSEVHFKDGKTADEEYMQAVLLAYSGMAQLGVNKEVLTLTEQLEPNQLALFVNELFDKWMEKGAEAKKKWVLYVTAIHGGADIVTKLQHQINEWAKNSRGAIAADAVRALALNDSPTALLVVDGIARKYKFKQVKAAAGKALEFAAQQLNLTTEELADRIVPDLGFNENMERIFEYGERQFKVYITPALEIEIYDSNDKKLKNMPAPGKKDDEAVAAASYAEFKQMKKQMKTTVANQKLRLELALSVERKWQVDRWKELFVKNPIMHQFAISLIWGLYENGVLKDTFRYMEDGSFNTVDEEEYEFPEKGEVGLVHPIELEEELRKQWEEQLSDYEIVQSIEQLKRPVYRIAEEEKKERTLTRFGGMILNGLSLSGKLQTMGWYKGPALDAGMFISFYREDKSCNLGVELYFSGVYIGDENDEITVYDARFYNPDTVKREYDEIKEENAMVLGEVPARYFSEIVYQLTKATVSSQEKNENWKEER